MTIGIDARLIEETGVGRYIRNLIAGLGNLDRKNNYVVFLREKSIDRFHLPNARWRKVQADIPWHSLAEQIRMPAVFAREKLDLLHVPYFNVPLLYRGPFVVTIHDLTILHVNTGKATTLPWGLYQLRRLGYRIILEVGLRRAAKVIAVSESTASEIRQHYTLPLNRVVVTREGVDATLMHAGGVGQIGGGMSGPYFLYVGNAYPHKNLDVLVRAFARYRHDHPTHTLVMVGKLDYFYTRLKNAVEANGLGDGVIFLGAINDEKLRELYRGAMALVFPSRMEGFGLPALEALAVGCPVICSDIPVFHEVVGPYATFVDAASEDGWEEALARVVKEKHLPSARERALLLKKFSWESMARETLDCYEDSIRV